MKKILNALFLTLLAVFTFSSCSDVPAPYDILGEGDVPGLTGDGTKENPYDIAAASVKQDASLAWVQGYIVGCIDGEGKSISSESKFEAPFTIASNILIADNPTETNYKNCIPVQLVANTDVRSALNLKDNAGNLGKVVMIYGSLEKYFGVAGLKAASAAVLDGVEIGEGQGEEGELDPNNPLGLDVSGVPLTDFSNLFDDVQHQQDYSKAGWINKAVKGTRVWQGSIYDPQKYLAASTYGVNKGETAEYWLVTPYFTVGADKRFTFKATVNKYTETMSLKVFFLQLKDGKMERNEITVNGIPTSGTYQWTDDLAVDLTAYAGQNGFVGFQYVALRGDEVQTYGIDDIVYGEDGGEVVPGGDDPFGLDVSNPVESLTVDFEEITESNKTYALEGWINKAIEGNSLWNSYIFNSDGSKYIRNNSYGVAAGSKVESWLITPALSVKSSSKFAFDCAGANWGESGLALKIFFLQKDANGSVTKNEIQVAEIPTSGTNYEWARNINVDLSQYNGHVGFVGFQYTVASMPEKGNPIYQIDNIKLTNEGGAVEPITNLLTNSGFEEWTDNVLTAWGGTKVTNVSFSQSTDAYEGNSSVQLKGSSSNSRFGSNNIKLEAGTYSFSVFAKNVKGVGKIRLGYVAVNEDGSAVSSSAYKYLINSTDVSDAWVKYESSFELSEETLLSVFVASAKSGADNDFAIDLVSLIKEK